MPDIGYASMPVIPTFKGLQNDLEKGSSKALTAAGASGGDKFGRSASKAAGSRFRGAAKGIVAPLVGAFAAVQVGSFFKESVAEARESQKVGAITARVIKTTGKAAKVTAKQVGDLSTAISNKTGIDDEAVQAAANLLLTFTNVRNEVGKGNKVFDQATKLATDMGAALGGDPKSAAIQLGKALNDPVKGITALSRVGVSFTQQQKDQIAALVKSGDTLKAQKVILGELSREFGGTAAASSTAGEKASVAFGNIKESIGTALLPAIDDLENAFLKKGVPAIQTFVEWAQNKGVPAIKKFARVARPLVEDVLTKTRDILKDAMPYAEGFVDAFNKLPKSVKTGIAAAAVLSFTASKVPGGKPVAAASTATAKSILALFTPKRPLPVYVVNSLPGVPGKPGGPKNPGGLKVPPIVAASPYLLPLLTSGDQGPQKLTPKQKGANAAITGLSKDLGTDGQGNDKALAHMLATDSAKAFTIIRKAAKAAGEDVDTYLNHGAFPRSVAALAAVRKDFKRSGNAAKTLVDEVFNIGPAADNSKRHVSALLAALERVRQKQVVLDQGVTPARQGKVDRQLGGGMYVANMNVHGTSLTEVQRDAQHRRRARAIGAESFAP